MANGEPSGKPTGIIGQIARIRETANLLIEKELRERGVTGIVPAHGSVLFFLFKQESPVPMKTLVEQTGRVKSTITGIINTLERHGYIYRQEHDSDARSTLIGLTKKGRSLKEDFEAISVMLEEKVFGLMPAADRSRLMELLSVLENNLLQK
jgi:DNA-binding MarR family transcriptional regulator